MFEAHIAKVSREQYGPALLALWTSIEQFKRDGQCTFDPEVVATYFREAAEIEKQGEFDVLAVIIQVKGEFAVCRGEMLLEQIKK